MKIGFLAGTLGRGGAERQLINMLKALKSERIETRVLCLTRGEALERDIHELGIDIDWVGGPKNQFLRLGNIVRNIRQRPVDIVQSAHFYTNIYAALAGRILGIHSIGAIRNDLKSEIRSNGIFGKWQLRLPQKLIANSQIAVDRAISIGIRQLDIDLLRNVVDIEVGDRNPNGSDDINILFAGRLVSQKRPEIFLEMAAQLLRRRPSSRLKFFVVGDGHLRNDLERLAIARGLREHQLLFLGELRDMSDIYRKSDILVLTSEHEGTPNVILEAMAYGLPVVATKVGGVPGIVNNSCGILVEPTNIEELIAATMKLIDNRTLRTEMGNQGQVYVGKNHSFGYLQDRLRRIYSELTDTSLILGESRTINQ